MTGTVVAWTSIDGSTPASIESATEEATQSHRHSQARLRRRARSAAHRARRRQTIWLSNRHPRPLINTKALDQHGEDTERSRQLDLLEREAVGELGGRNETVRPSLAVNADPLGTWFLTALARAAQRHPLAFDLHREDDDFTAGLLESGSVMAAVTSRARAVGGCRARPLGILRYEPFASPDFVDRWFADGQDAQAYARGTRCQLRPP